MSIKRELNKWLYIPVFILLVNFIVRLVDQSKLMKFFPLDFVNDISSYMAQLFFLAKCGFYQTCPYWYNGFITFKYSPPGWYFFTLPLYHMFNQNVLVATYISMVLLFIIGFMVVYYLGKIHSLNFIKRIAFFIFFFGNAIAIGNFIRLGRLHELMGWVLLLCLFFILFYYKDKKFDWRSVSIPLVFGAITFTHNVIMILAAVLLFSLFLVKKSKEKIILIGYGLLGFLLTSFWFIPNLLDFKNSWSAGHTLTINLLNFKVLPGENIISLIIPIALWVVFVIYWEKQDITKRDLLFYVPILILSVLYITRAVIIIPVLNLVYPDAYHLFFLIFILFLFFKTKYTKEIYSIILIGLVLFSIASVGYNFLITPKFPEHSELAKETLDVLEKVNGKFIIFSKRERTPDSYFRAYYSYAPIFLDLKTPGGWYPPLTSLEHNENLKKIYSSLEYKDCESLKSLVDVLDVDEIMSYDRCLFLKECGFKYKYWSERVCLFEK